MPSFDPSQLATWTDGHWTALPRGVLTGFSHDTRALRAGDVFVALRTGKRDGHDFLPAAQTAGASAAIVSTPNPGLALPQLVVADPLAAFQKIAATHRAAFQAAGGIVIGISGSAGKTSTKNLLAGILRPAGVLATEGNLNNHIGVPLTLTRLDPALHRYAVIEVGISAPGEMETLTAMIAPDHAIITMVAPAHTQDLGDIDGVAREKAVLLEHVKANGMRIFPSDCLKFSAFATLSTGIALRRTTLDTVRLMTVPTCAKRIFANVSLTFMAKNTGLTLSVNSDSPLHDYTLRCASLGMAQNAALAITLALHLGVSDSQIQSALASWKPAKWRGEILRDSDGRLFYLDLYNANPASMADALDAFSRVAPAGMPRLYVIGCMEELGPDAARHHRELGQNLSQFLRPRDEALLIGDLAPCIAAGITPPSSKIIIASASSEIAARIAAFQGAIFLKGSRRHALENALPASLLSATAQPC